MDIVRFKGGLGNQMFQYAFIEALRSKGRKVGGNLGFYRRNPNVMPFVLDKVYKNVNIVEIDDKEFNEIDKRWRTIKENKVLMQSYKYDIENRFFYVEEGHCTYLEEVFLTKDCTFVGYWQTEKYFVSIRDKILQCFNFTIQEKKLRQLGEEIKKGYIGIHIRRGDYLTLNRFNICTLDYYKKAIYYMKKIYPTAKYIFFSDDVEWVKNNFEEKNMIICERCLFDAYQDWYDMYLMTLCKGIVMSNSSFSWWGAWLNQKVDKVVISPKIWMNGEETPDIWCDQWIKL